MANKEKKKILVFIDWYLPGYKAGGPVRSMVNMLDHLSDDFDFYVVTRNTEYGETLPYKGIEPDKWLNYSKAVKVWYCDIGSPSLNLWRRLIKESDCQLVYINGIYSFYFSILPLLAAKLLRFKDIIVAPRGMLAESAININKAKKKLFLRLTKIVRFYKGLVWHVSNEIEAGQVKKRINPKALLVLASNLPPLTISDFVSLKKTPGSLLLCSAARIAPEKNTLYAIKCLKDLPGDVCVQFNLYGQIYSKAYWQECLKEINLLPDNIKVAHSGFIKPEDIPDTIKKHHALFMPTTGENFGHIILESFLSGRPVLISDQTPWRKLEEKNVGWDLPLNNHQLFKEKLMVLIQADQNSFEKLCRDAWNYGQEYIDNDALLDKYRAMFNRSEKIK